MLMLQSPQSVDPSSPIDSHSELSVFLIFLILLLTLLITVTIYFLTRCLRARSLLHPSPSSSGECAICLMPFQPEDKLRHLPLCCHAFHDDCISIWLISNQTCPLCRSPLFSSNDDAATETASLAADIGHDGSRSWLRDLSRGISSRALSFRDSGRFFTGSSRRMVAMVDLEAGEEIGEYFQWLSTV